MSKLDLLQHFTVFILDIRLWTGRKSLKPADLEVGGVDLDKLPPGPLANLGSKRIIGKDALSPFQGLKREAEKLCLERGVRFLGGYAIPMESAEELANQLATLEDRFIQERTTFLQQYDTNIDAWISEVPHQWAPIIRAAVEPPERVKQALQFHYSSATISAPEGISRNGLAQQTEGLFGQLCHEVRQAARMAHQASYLNKSRVTRKALRPIVSIRKKLEGLLFIDPLIHETIETIDLTLAAVPDKGPIEGACLHQLAGLLGSHLSYLGLSPSEGAPSPEVQDDQFELSEHRPTACGTTPLSWDF